MTAYKAYIEAREELFRSEGRAMRGWCHPEATTMVKTFPELRLVKGYFVETTGVRWHHWWCQLDSEIIDPTASQFSGMEGDYEEYDPEKHEPLPVGKCYECGEFIYPGEDGEPPYSFDFCSSVCSSSFRASL